MNLATIYVETFDNIALVFQRVFLTDNYFVAHLNHLEISYVSWYKNIFHQSSLFNLTRSLSTEANDLGPFRLYLAIYSLFIMLQLCLKQLQCVIIKIQNYRQLVMRGPFVTMGVGRIFSRGATRGFFQIFSNGSQNC